MQRPQTARFSSGPIRTRDAQKAQRGNYKNFNKSGPLTQNQRPKTRGAFTDPMKRKETSETRKRGACLRCRMQRIRCYPDPRDDQGPCLTCQGITGPTQSKLPCLRYKISETALFDKGPHPQFIWSQRWKEMKIIEIQEWEPSDIKTIELTQDMGNTSYQLKVRKFVPVEGDSLERKWNTNGEQRSYRCANYAIVNMEETGQQMLKFVEDNITTAISFYIDDKDELLRETYGMAYKHSEIAEAKEERILLRSVLKLWVAVRMESRSERICGQEHLGMVPQTFDQAAKNYNQVLVPPVMSAQVELIMTAVVLQPLKKSVLTQLQELIKANRSQSWFTIYLCLFVLLHSCALLTSFENMQAKKYGLQSRYVYDTFIEELHNGSKIMLAYFHYCNKGSHPFAMDWTIERNIRQAELKPEQLEFLVRTTQLVKERAAIFDEVKKKGEFEHDFFFLCQLYDITWQALRTI
ncbi:hypothetical protein L207DRAFT_419813 [Hyaloscypha variabilis F]|uniref:Zn(2)-C6 fungal-type domain-containing protein n=1 Tax=Hyaloscypha variabilis (strain UAMH 11265 / GT02V1 / F) TaxID=1149755 RepID=A0A2J6S4P1_HYAVF|nr:hypothetical protein L207DRAFT_419813 [Hyaloscypha variabilis F]